MIFNFNRSLRLHASPLGLSPNLEKRRKNPSQSRKIRLRADIVKKARYDASSKGIRRMNKSDVLPSPPVPSKQTEEIYVNGPAETEAMRPVPVPDSSQEQSARDLPPLAFSDLLRLINPERNRLIVSGILAIVSVVFGLAPFVLISRLTPDLFAGRIEPGTVWMLAWAAVIAVVLKVLNEDVEQIELFVAHQIPDLVSAAALPLLTAAYLFTVDWRMTLVAIDGLHAKLWREQEHAHGWKVVA